MGKVDQVPEEVSVPATGAAHDPVRVLLRTEVGVVAFGRGDVCAVGDVVFPSGSRRGPIAASRRTSRLTASVLRPSIRSGVRTMWQTDV
jgi:hypothetical protein